jgi:hypothetical protein
LAASPGCETELQKAVPQPGAKHASGIPTSRIAKRALIVTVRLIALLGMPYQIRISQSRRAEGEKPVSFLSHQDQVPPLADDWRTTPRIEGV